MDIKIKKVESTVDKYLEELGPSIFRILKRFLRNVGTSLQNNMTSQVKTKVILFIVSSVRT
jgi:hypothetical protein